MHSDLHKRKPPKCLSTTRSNRVTNNIRKARNHINRDMPGNLVYIVSNGWKRRSHPLLTLLLPKSLPRQLHTNHQRRQPVQAHKSQDSLLAQQMQQHRSHERTQEHPHDEQYGESDTTMRHHRHTATFVVDLRQQLLLQRVATSSRGPVGRLYVTDASWTTGGTGRKPTQSHRHGSVHIARIRARRYRGHNATCTCEQIHVDECLRCERGCERLRQ